jgi:hypothetical protein
MKKFLLMLVMVMFAGQINAPAQGTVTPNTEFYTGYQGVNSVENFDFSSTVHGVNGSATWYVSDSSESLPIGVTAEGAGNFKDGQSLVSAMAGLTLKARQFQTFQPFLHGLAGVTRCSSNGVCSCGSGRFLSVSTVQYNAE